ncbi:unnamed protein product, partial [Aduncisulcus paluster]
MKLRKDLIILAHGNFIGAHKGINATLKTLKSWGIVWVNIRRDVSKVIKQCLVCQRERLSVSPLESQGSTFVDAPFHCISVDTIGPFPESENGNKFCLSVIDTFTRHIQLFPTKTT